MSTEASSSEDAPELAFLRGGGEMGARMREFDWASTPLGPPKQWAQSLKTAVRIMLTSRQPIWIGWGAELIYLYNDPYQAIIGEKHPDALGKPRMELRATATAPGHAAQLDLHHRNSLRLLRW